jgi:uncharacterized protein YecE (DUF72 family)
MAIGIACGSWADPEYAGLLYPRGFASELRLAGYATWFDCVEVNASYYATPKKEAVAKWVANTPPDFRFDVRLHRAFSISPEKTARDGRLLDFLFTALEPMLRARKLGTFLLVLDPRFGPENHRLEELDVMIEKIRPYSVAIELRDPAWVADKARASTLAYFRERRVTWVAVDMPRLPKLMPPVDEVTNPRLAYLRLHGRNRAWLKSKTAAERHTYLYDPRELGEIVKRIRRLAVKAKEVRVVANNHAYDYAPQTALALRELLNQL